METSPLVGREREKRLLISLLDEIQVRGTTLVIRGQIGIGKSSLLNLAHGLAQERGVRLLSSAGTVAESYLPFAGLHRLLRSALGSMDRLPAPQRNALRAAFGMSDEAAPDLYLIALATLNLLGEVAATTPLLLAVDDAQWLDRPTSDVLAFLARRLESDPIVLLITVRDGSEDPLADSGLPELQLQELDDVAAGALLDAHAPELAPTVRERLLANAAGNPLALVELPLALRSADVVGEAMSSSLLPLTTRLEQAFAKRLGELPASVRTLLLIAAINENGSLSEILYAAARMGGQTVSLETLDPAVAAGLVEIGPAGLRFRHPLMRSAIYQAASPFVRQAAHAAMAAILTGDAERDRRAWHRAASIVGTDETIAVELETAATRAQRRGAVAVAIAALERAAQVTDDPSRKGGYLLQATEAAVELGRHDDALRLLQQIEVLELDPVDAPRLAWLREFTEGSWSGATRLRTFADIADGMRLHGDPSRALDALVSVALRCYWSNPDQEVRDLLVATAERIPTPEDDPRLIYILALVDPARRGDVVLERLSRMREKVGSDPRTAHLLGVAGSAIGAFDLAELLYEAAVAGFRAQGRLGLLAQTLVHQASCGLHLGNWSVARRAVEEAVRLTHETNQPLWIATAHLIGAALAAYRGDSEAAGALVASAEGVLLPIGATPMLALVQFARGASSLAVGRHTEAYAHLRRIFDPSDAAHHRFLRAWVLVDLVEAAVNSDQEDEVRGIAEELETLLAGTRSPLLRAGVTYARFVLGGDDAEASFRAGLQTGLERWPFHRARLLLTYGVWLRRQRRIAESREPLASSRDAFDALGAVPWGERARTELRASGVTSRPRTVQPSDELSPQELQIAQLAAAGLSNREIGQQLYLSHRTVSSHLYRVFPKLGITSRHQLTTVLGR